MVFFFGVDLFVGVLLFVVDLTAFFVALSLVVRPWLVVGPTVDDGSFGLAFLTVNFFGLPWLVWDWCVTWLASLALAWLPWYVCWVCWTGYVDGVILQVNLLYLVCLHLPHLRTIPIFMILRYVPSIYPYSRFLLFLDHSGIFLYLSGWTSGYLN